MCIEMTQITNIQDLKTAINKNGEMVIAMNNNDIVKELRRQKKFATIHISYFRNKK